MTAPMVHPDDVHGFLILVGKLMQKEVKVGHVPRRELQHATFPRPWCHSAIQRKILKAPLYKASRFHPSARDPSPLHRPQPHAPLVLAPAADRPFGRWVTSRRALCELVLQQGRTMLRKGSGVFRIVV
jgi:hypothetical protein